MATGISIHVGVNATEAAGISIPPLVGCENDAERMLEIARARGFIGLGDSAEEPIIKNDATIENVLGKIRIAASELKAGDIFLFTFSGHGTRQGEEDEEEQDLQDETLVLHDGLLLDNLLRRLVWPAFSPGVRVVMVSDSCHSGGAAMSALHDSDREAGDDDAGGGKRQWSRNGFGIRAIPEGQAQTHLEILKDFYRELQKDLPEQPPPLAANILLLAACKEHETTRDGDPNGMFTQALLDVWHTNGSKTYKQLMDGIAQKLEQQGAGSHPVMLSIPDSPGFGETEAFRI